MAHQLKVGLKKKKHDECLGLEQKVQQLVGCRKKYNKYLKIEQKVGQKTSIFSRKYNLHFDVTFQISPPMWISKSNS